ncbi:hypothetical protein A1Q2_03092 [Trichosporon asahii var. asahii CBS 8904]|uniref:N-acetyltransferase domain-containing protein n=2 Tax=Trichosporon asahii var. asahii TaxID=189963 RepID=K1VPZ9_TRIAC|nr:hypothetical protein A1Q1_06854 [Trichosporon asahii var. asahii CBS 2479]EJT51901.1 hypothetical protein A1Q1_06854 [Trichosporon asahii var. asahii CBS 2479]EKD02666.1 hypothetical protein A1Q2_03092 [Trichosporon asahii var. asahii CBS 8904]
MLSIRRLEPSSPPSEIDAASELLTSVFADDQLTRIVSSPVPGLHAARTRSTLVTGVLDLAVFTAHESECEKLLGVLILKPPGIVDRHSDVVLANYARLRSHVHKLEEDAFGGVTNLWFVSFVGVSPEAQGKGVGRVLCDAAARLVRDKADETGVRTLALVAISEDAMRFYKRLGFEERGYVEFKVGDELVKRWAMSKEC